MQLPHVISAKDFTRAQLDELFIKASRVKKLLAKNYYQTDGSGHIIKDFLLIRHFPLRFVIEII